MMDIVEFQLPGCEQGGQINACCVFKGIFHDEMKVIRAQGLRVHKDLQVHRSIWPLQEGMGIRSPSPSPILYSVMDPAFSCQEAESQTRKQL